MYSTYLVTLLKRGKTVQVVINFHNDELEDKRDTVADLYPGWVVLSMKKLDQ